MYFWVDSGLLLVEFPILSGTTMIHLTCSVVFSNGQTSVFTYLTNQLFITYQLFIIYQLFMLSILPYNVDNNKNNKHYE